LAPQFPFEYFFLDERLDQLYTDQATLRDLVLIFSLIAIFISCIGLFALTSFIVEQRTKEIGIRKILGAESVQLMLLVGREFMRLVLISFLLAGPLTYFLLSQWLSEFALHIGIDWTVYLITALLSVFISILTISYHSFKVTRTDPVMALKYE
jgi:putative ABC transport system permease protein